MLDLVNDNRVTQLKAILVVLAEAIDAKPGARDLAQLSRQYRETLKEIEEVEGVEADDEIEEILAEREAGGKPGAVRKTRA